MVIDAERPARESVAVWAARLGYYLWGEPAHEGAQVSTCPGLYAWALLLATLTLLCAAGPDRWRCGRPAWATTCGVNPRMKGPRCPPVRPMLPPLWPVASSLWPVASSPWPVAPPPRRLSPSVASGTYPSNTTRFITQSCAPTDLLRRPLPTARPDGPPSLPVAHHAPRRTSYAARRPPPVATRSAASRPTGRWAVSAARKSPAHPQCRRRNAPRARQEKTR